MHFVITTATGRVLRYGECDFEHDGSFNPAVESIIETTLPETDPLMMEWNGAALVESLTALKEVRIAQVTVANDALFAKGALHDGKRFAITKADHAGWLALVISKDALPYPYQVYTINPPAPYLLANADAVVGLVMGVLFPRCSWIYATGQAIDDAVMAATSKAEIDAIVDDRE